MNEIEFEKAFRDFFTPLSNIAYSVLKDEDTAKDIVQQVFLKLWHKKETLEIRTHIKSYLHRAVINSALNHLKKDKRIQFDADVSKYPVEDIEYNSEVETSRLNLEKNIKKAIDNLPQKCHVVFTLSRFNNMSNKEIANHLKISIKAVEKHIGRAMKELRVTLRPYYESLLLILFIVIIGGRVF